ncbi:hypothetical protein [Comamonas endophytica]|uniref:hypothetical protein n=1 Tax=Comamonas endophytica TaxID=2949090 RepID=UPI003672C6FA
MVGQQVVHQLGHCLHIGLAPALGGKQQALVDDLGQLAPAFGQLCQQRQLQLARDLLRAQFQAPVVAPDDQPQPLARHRKLLQLLQQLGGADHAGHALVADHPDLAGAGQHVLEHLRRLACAQVQHDVAEVVAEPVEQRLHLAGRTVVRRARQRQQAQAAGVARDGALGHAAVQPALLVHGIGETELAGSVEIDGAVAAGVAQLDQQAGQRFLRDALGIGGQRVARRMRRLLQPCLQMRAQVRGQQAAAQARARRDDGGLRCARDVQAGGWRAGQEVAHHLLRGVDGAVDVEKILHAGAQRRQHALRVARAPDGQPRDLRVVLLQLGRQGHRGIDAAGIELDQHGIGLMV